VPIPAPSSISGAAGSGAALSVATLSGATLSGAANLGTGDPVTAGAARSAPTAPARKG
jgi:hypothetical protein